MVQEATREELYHSKEFAKAAAGQATGSRTVEAPKEELSRSRKAKAKECLHHHPGCLPIMESVFLICAARGG